MDGQIDGDRQRDCLVARDAIPSICPPTHLPACLVARGAILSYLPTYPSTYLGNASTGNIPELSHLGELKGLHLPQPMAASPYGNGNGNGAPGNGNSNGTPAPGAAGGGGVDVAAALAAIARGGQS